MIVITGASDGIGAAIARRLSREDYELILLGRDEEKLAAVSKECMGAKYFAFDLNDREAMEKVVNEFGDVQVLINNAGVWHKTKYIEYLSDDDVLETINTNLTSQILLTKKLLSSMKKRGSGAVINIVSSAGLVGDIGRGAYAPSKFGMRGFTEVLHAETKGTGVRVAGVYQGGTNTRLFEKAGESSDDFPRDSYTEPDDLADVIAYMLSRPAKLWIKEVRIEK